MGYSVLRADAAEGPYEEIGQTDVPAYTDSAADTSVIHYYVVKAFNASGASAASDAAASAVYVPPVPLPDGEIDLPVRKMDFCGPETSLGAGKMNLGDPLGGPAAPGISYAAT